MPQLRFNLNFKKRNIPERERKRVNSHSNVFSFQNLLKAYYKCRKNKRNTANAAKFELRFEKELLKLEYELKNHFYHPGRSICFVVKKPKLREVFAADFRDRVVHHLLVGYLEPFWERKFIHHSYSCRKNKGAQLAIKDLKRFSRKITENFTKPAYYLQADVSAFFMSLKKDILFRIISKHLKNKEFLWLAKQIIFHDPTKNFYKKGDKTLFNLIPNHKSLFKVPSGQGLPIGNLTSQFFANVYLNSLDQFAKHGLKIKYYLRYVDDLLILHRDPKQLTAWRRQIEEFLEKELRLKLHSQKTVLQPIKRGINFVGFIVKPRYSLMRRKIVINLKEKLYKFNCAPIPTDYEIFKQELKKILATINSYYGQFKHANTFNLRKALYNNHFGSLKSYLSPDSLDFNYFKIKTISKKLSKTRKYKAKLLPAAT